MSDFLKKFFFLFAAAGFLLSSPALAKKEKTLRGEKYKPKNEKILKILWSRGLKGGKPGRRYYPETSSPVLSEGRVFIGTQAGFFYAINAEDGKIIWQFENGDPIASTACVTNGRVIFADLEGHVVALDAQSGEKIWAQSFGEEILGKITNASGRIFFLLGEQEVVALSEDTGAVSWRQNIPTFVKSVTMRGRSAVVPDGDRLFVGLADGQVYALGINGGNVLWSRSLFRPLTTFKDVDADVIVSDGSVFVGGYGDTFSRLDRNSGQILWTSEVDSGVEALVFADRVILSDTHGRVVALSKSSGEQLWFNELNHSIAANPILFKSYSGAISFQEKIFVATYDDDAFVLDPDNGDELQKISIGQGALSSPVSNDGAIYLLSNGGALLRLQSLVPKK